MKWRFAAGLVVFVLVLVGGGRGSAQAGVDISKYMPWQAGQWVVLQEYDPLDSSCADCYLKKEEKGGNVVSKSGSYTIVSHYNFDEDASVWKESGPMKYLRTAEFVKLVAAKIDNKWWTFNPVISIPRSLNVNQPFVYNGVRSNGTTNQPFSLVLTVAKTGISVTTPARSFADCIQTQWVYVMSKEAAVIETKVMAKGVGEVKIWNASLTREATGFAAEAFSADTEYHEVIEQGLSGAPFP
jgi:hypothetical protein